MDFTITWARLESLAKGKARRDGDPAWAVKSGHHGISIITFGYDNSSDIFRMSLIGGWKVKLEKQKVSYPRIVTWEKV